MYTSKFDVAIGVKNALLKGKFSLILAILICWGTANLVNFYVTNIQTYYETFSLAIIGLGVMWGIIKGIELATASDGSIATYLHKELGIDPDLANATVDQIARGLREYALDGKITPAELVKILDELKKIEK